MDFEKLMNEPLGEGETIDILDWFYDVYGKETYQYINVKRLVDEIDKLRDIQTKLIDQLKKADEYADKIEWKLFWETKDEIINKVLQKRYQEK